MSSLLSLQDTCKFYILFSLESFPAERLALLPIKMRRLILLGLSLADLLHLDGTAAITDMDRDELFRCHNQRDVNRARRTLLDAIFSQPHYLRGLLRLDLEAALSCSSYDYLQQRILSLKPTAIYTTDRTVIPPRFASVYSRFDSAAIELLLRYCNVRSAPAEVGIDCFLFTLTDFWKDYLGLVETAKKKADPFLSHIERSVCSRLTHADSTLRLYTLAHISNFKVKVDPTIPFIHKFFSTVEVLELGTSRPFEVQNLGLVSYIILYNIITSKHPHLKHLKVYGNTEVTYLIVSSVAKLLHYATEGSIFCDVELAIPSSAPYLLEGLSLLPSECCNSPSAVFGKIEAPFTNACVTCIAPITSVIFVRQQHRLKDVAVPGLLGYCSYSCCFPEAARECQRRRQRFCSLLVQLLKMQQVYSVNLGESQLPEAYELIKTFLYTPTTHSQSLSITALGGEISSRQLPVHQPPQSYVVPPESNAQYKHLDLGQSSSCVHSWLFSIPELRLKKLIMKMWIPDTNLKIVPADLIVQVEHVAFFYTHAISPVYLEKFTICNPFLKRLEFSNQCACDLFPALSHCLSNLNQEGRNLEELQLNSIDFEGVDPREVFTHVRNLSQRCGTTLVLSPVCWNLTAYGQPTSSQPCLFTYYQLTLLLPALGEEFREKKIRTIVCKLVDYNSGLNFESTRSCLELIADKVIVHYL